MAQQVQKEEKVRQEMAQRLERRERMLAMAREREEAR